MLCQRNSGASSTAIPRFKKRLFQHQTRQNYIAATKAAQLTIFKQSPDAHLDHSQRAYGKKVIIHMAATLLMVL